MLLLIVAAVIAGTGVGTVADTVAEIVAVASLAFDACSTPAVGEPLSDTHAASIGSVATASSVNRRQKVVFT